MNDSPTDHPDALLDRGLTELLGGETPPDLSDRIIAAASAAQAPVHWRERNPLVSKERPWIKYVLAASIFLVIGGILLPEKRALRESARNDVQPRSEELVATKPPALSKTSKEQSREKSGIDTGIGLRGLINDAESPKTGEELMMTVTPHIIIQEEEEERLGIPTEEQSERPGIQSEKLGDAPNEKTNVGRTAEMLEGKTISSPYYAPPEIEALYSQASPAEIASKKSEAELQRRAANAQSPPISPEQKAQMVDEFNNLRDQQRYSEMEAVAKKLYDTDPNDPVAQQVWNNARFIRRVITGDELKRLSEQGAQANYVLSWQSLSKKRSEEITDDFGGNIVNQSIPQLSTSPEEIMIRTELGLRAAGSSSVDETLIEDVSTLIAMKERSLREKSQLSELEKAEAAELVADIAKLRKFHQRLHRVSSRDQYTPIHENPFIKADGPDAVSTFSIDVDTASYANVRQYLEQSRQLPPADAVRIEELVNYFDYDYAGPTDDTPFAAHMEVAACPWNKEHRLARIAIKGKEIARDERPQSNLVFLVDVSGSMDEPNKLPLLVEGMKMLTRELGENDRVAIVVYASSEGMALPSTRGDQQETILAALDQLRAGGSTAGGAGINLAYSIALDNFIEGGTNRVILCTDGDFNVGVTDTAQLEHLAEQKAKTGVFLTVLGFGRGNLNDAMMEGISNKGNGNYHYVDNLTEARKVLVEEMAGTLVTIAKDVKIQVEFNPAEVAGYRLIGCENRLLKTEDFNNDKKDAGEIGAGHTVTALYEIIPAGQEVTPTSVDPLKYQQPLAGLADEPTKSTKITKPQAASDELLTLKLRYKLPDATKSTKLEFPITDSGESFADATDDFQFAAAVASFGMLLRHSQYQGETSFDAVQEIAQSSLGNDPHNYRGEFLELVRIAKELTTNQRE